MPHGCLPTTSGTPALNPQTIPHAPRRTNAASKSKARSSKRAQPYSSTPRNPSSNEGRLTSKRVGAACEPCHAIHKQCVGGPPCERCVSMGRIEQCIEHKCQKHHDPASSGTVTPTWVKSVAASSAPAVASTMQGIASLTSDVASSTSGVVSSTSGAASFASISALCTYVPEQATSTTALAMSASASATSASNVQVVSGMAGNHGDGLSQPGFARCTRCEDWTWLGQLDVQPSAFPLMVQLGDGFPTGPLEGMSTGHHMPMHDQFGYNPVWPSGAAEWDIHNPSSTLVDFLGTSAPSVPQFSMPMNMMWGHYAPEYPGVLGLPAQQWLNMQSVGFDESFGARQQVVPRTLHYYS